MSKPKTFRPWNPEQTLLLPPSPVEAFFFSGAHSDADIEATLAAARRSLAAVA